MIQTSEFCPIPASDSGEYTVQHPVQRQPGCRRLSAKIQWLSKVSSLDADSAKDERLPSHALS